jgi:D-alanine-D-alanine ligase
MTGGVSSEREVSLSSGRSILTALRDKGHFVKVIDPLYGGIDVNENLIFRENIKKEYPTSEKLKRLTKDSQRGLISCINSALFDDIELVFLALHGKFGEDGKIQTLLELRGIKYTGSGVISSAVAMDKDVSKSLFRYSGIETPDWITLEKKNYTDLEDTYDKIINLIGYPFVIKPNDEGSTVGLTILKNKGNIRELNTALKSGFEYSDKLIIEKYIKGRELTVPIIGEEAFPLLEIIPKDGFYDYEHKYQNCMSDYECPAGVSKGIKMEAERLALKAHNSLGCSVYSRVDFILSEDEKLYCLEVNTLPGMTSLSLVPKSAKSRGIEFPELIELIIDLSLKERT